MKVSVRPFDCSIASPGSATAAMKLTMKLSLMVQSVYQSSSVPISEDVTRGSNDSGWSSEKSKKMRPVEIDSVGFALRRSWCEMRFELEIRYPPAISPCHQVL